MSRCTSCGRAIDFDEGEGYECDGVPYCDDCEPPTVPSKEWRSQHLEWVGRRGVLCQCFTCLEHRAKEQRHD